jgi:hypothetical protein
MGDTGLTLMTDREVAARFGFSLPWLRQKRVVGGGIPFAKIGRRVLYRLQDVERYVAERVVGSTSEVPTIDQAR